jgi:tetrahydromethanopterin S-methyltransferase subunit F
MRIRSEVRIYLTGGSTAVLKGWRDTTVDIDLSFEPEVDEIFRAIPDLKEKLQMNIELAAPSDFIPELPGWRERSQFIAREGKVNFYHYDAYSQALSKIERNHEKDVEDVAAMFRTGLIEREKLLELFETIRPELYKYPALDPESFARAVREAVRSQPE